MANDFLESNLQDAHRTPIQISKYVVSAFSTNQAGSGRDATNPSKHQSVPESVKAKPVEKGRYLPHPVLSVNIERAQSYLKIAKIQEEDAQISEAMEHYNESLRLYKAGSHTFGVIEVELAIAALYGKMGEDNSTLDRLQGIHSLVQSDGSPHQYLVFLTRLAKRNYAPLCSTIGPNISGGIAFVPRKAITFRWLEF